LKSGVEKYGEGFHGMCNDLVDHAGKDSVDAASIASSWISTIRQLPLLI